MNTTLSLAVILSNFVQEYPRPGEKPELSLTVGTHDPDRDTSKFRLSDAGKCRLMRFLKRKGVEVDHALPASVLLQMQAGNLLHAWIEKAVAMQGFLMSAEAALEDEHRIGHYDMILRNPVTGQTILYDIKTIHNKKAFYMQRDGTRADEQHIAQVVTYYLAIDEAWRFANADTPPPDAVRLAYVVRDTMEIREVDLIWLEKCRAEVREDWEILIRAWEAGKQPQANPSGWECRYCAYNQVCGSAQA